MVGCWGTRVVFFMVNQRSTRVQRICKKLQTVKGVGWPAAWSLAWPLEILGKEEGCRDFFWGEGLLFGDFGQREGD